MPAAAAWTESSWSLWNQFLMETIYWSVKFYGYEILKFMPERVLLIVDEHLQQFHAEL